jgi:hypothetical protein
VNQAVANLVASLKQAKQAEALASNHRLAIEAQIVALFPPQTGEATVKQDDLTITYKTTRSIDSAGVQQAWNDLSKNAQTAFKVKFDLDLKNYRAINELDAVTAAIVNQFITSKPAKPTLTLKETNGI